MKQLLSQMCIHEFMVTRWNLPLCPSPHRILGPPWGSVYYTCTRFLFNFQPLSLRDGQAWCDVTSDPGAWEQRRSKPWSDSVISVVWGFNNLKPIPADPYAQIGLQWWFSFLVRLALLPGHLLRDNEFVCLSPVQAGPGFQSKQKKAKII